MELLTMRYKKMKPHAAPRPKGVTQPKPHSSTPAGKPTFIFFFLGAISLFMVRLFLAICGASTAMAVYIF